MPSPSTAPLDKVSQRAVIATVFLATSLGALAQTPPPGVTKALDALLDSAAPPEAIEAHATIRAEFAAFVDEHKRAPWDELDPPETLDTPEKLGAKIDVLSDGRTVDEFVRHTGEFLLRHPAHPEFPKRLWELASVASSLEVEGKPSPLFDAPVAMFLFALCDKLPANDAFRLEAAMAAARYHHALGQFEEEEERLRRLLDADNLPAPVRAATRSLLGLCLESQKRFDDALVVYAKATASLDLYPAAFDSTLRAILIHLASGRRAEAGALLQKLATADPALRKLSRSQRDIDALLTLLAEPGALDRFWEHGDGWWDAWVALRGDLGHDRPADEIRIPDLPAIHGIGPALAAEVGRRESDTFYEQLDLVMHALRRSPSVIGEAGAALCFLAPQVSPDHQQAIYEVVVQVCKDFPTPDRDLSRSAQLYLTVAYSDGGKPGKALAVIEAFRADDPSPDELSDTMARLWAHLSLAEEKDLAGPRAALEKLLASGDQVQNRAQTVLYLVQILSKLELPEEEAKLIDRELENPAVRADAAIAAGLQARRRALDSGGGNGGNFAAAVTEWRDKHAPGWLRFALTSGLEDPRLKDRPLAELLDPDTMAKTGIGAEERVQLELIAAGSGELSLAARDRAFRSAFAVLYVTEPTHSGAKKMLRAVLKDDRFPEPLRQMVLIFSLDQALASGRTGDITGVLTHPLLDRENERLAAAATAYGRYGSTDLGSTESLMDCYRELCADRVGASEITVIAQVFERLLTLGAIAQAEEIMADVKGWQLEPNAGQDKTTLRMAFLKAVKHAKGSVPFAKAMRGHLEAYFGEGRPPELSRKQLDLRADIDLVRLPESDAFGLLAARGLVPGELHSSPEFWMQLAELMPRDEKQEAFSFTLMHELLASELPDIDRSFAVFSAPAIIDTDDADLLTRLLKLFDQHRDPQEQPFTHAAMRIVEVQSRDLRRGAEVDLEEAWRGLDHPSLGRILLPNKLRNLMARRELGKLRAALGLVPADRLLSPDLLDTTWPALAMAKMDDEAQLAGEAMLEVIPRAVAGAARTLNLSIVADVYQTAERLDKPGLVPEGWFEYLDSQIIAERERYSLRILDGEHRADWAAVAAAAGKAVEEFPSYYNYYRPRGIALHHLGETEKAIAALEVYTKYSRDEVEWKDTLDLLEKLKAK